MIVQDIQEHHEKRLKEEGFTLVEVMVTIAIVGMMMLMLASVGYGNWQNWSTDSNINLLQQDLQFSIDFIAENVRQADTVSVVPDVDPTITHLVINKSIAGVNHVYDVKLSPNSLQMQVDGTANISNLLRPGITLETGSAITMPPGESAVRITLIGKKGQQVLSVDTIVKPRIWGFN